MAAKPEKGIWLRKLVLAIWGLLCFLPILFFATIALRPRNEIIAPQPIYFPTLTIETWAKILEEWPLLTYFKNSVMAIGGSVFICLLLGIPAAYALARYNFRGKEDLAFTFLSFRFAPELVVIIPLSVIYRQLGLYDTYFGIMWVYQLVTLPLLMPTMTVVLVLAFIRAVQVFDQVFVLTGGGPGTATLYIVQYIFRQAFVVSPRQYGMGAAASLLLALVLLVLTLAQLYFARRSEAT